MGAYWHDSRDRISVSKQFTGQFDAWQKSRRREHKHRSKTDDVARFSFGIPRRPLPPPSKRSTATWNTQPGRLAASKGINVHLRRLLHCSGRVRIVNAGTDFSQHFYCVGPVSDRNCDHHRHGEDRHGDSSKDKHRIDEDVFGSGIGIYTLMCVFSVAFSQKKMDRSADFQI